VSSLQKSKQPYSNDSDLKVLEINVVTLKSVVQLSGFVKSEADKHHAIEIARSVEGVKSVKDDMRTK
jgi:osmotically-inducible protein OsmY